MIILIVSIAISFLFIPLYLLHYTNKSIDKINYIHLGIHKRSNFNKAIIVSCLLGLLSIPFIKKESIPPYSSREIVLNIDWNEGLSYNENIVRISEVLDSFLIKGIDNNPNTHDTLIALLKLDLLCMPKCI
jgi:hypothetical protein